VTSDWRCEQQQLPEVNIVKILPRISQVELFARKKCYLGISLENPLFEGDSLKAMLLWAADKFEHCLVIIGDYLCRFNEQILNGCDANRASELAIKLGDSFLSRTRKLFEQLPAGKLHLTRWKEHLQTAEFGCAKALLDELFESDEGFRTSIEYDALSFVERQKRHNLNLAVGVEEAIRLSSQYILEEVAVFSLLSERGWSTELYPGSELRVLVEVAKGRYPRVPKGLKDRVSVELRISQQGQQ
jgi:tRNA-dependent cyclodipeptide synthase